MCSPLASIPGSLRILVLAFIFSCSAFFNAYAQIETEEPNTFTLIDSRTNKPISGFDPIPPNATLNLNQLPLHINIRANLNEDVGSVKFGFRDRDKFSVENEAPFAMFGNVAGDYKEGHIPIGSYTLTATPYQKKNARGKARGTFSVSFNVVQEGAPLEVSAFILVNAETNEDLFEIEDHTKLDLTSLPPHLNIRAEVKGRSKSLKWRLIPKQGMQNEYTNVENTQPYALFGDAKGDYINGTLVPGEYSLSATAFRHGHAKGTKGIPHTVRINIIDGSATQPGAYQGINNTPTNNQDTRQNHKSGLEPAYPNPFNPTTTIRFSLTESTHARLVIYDMLGRQVKTLADGQHDAGSHAIVFEAGDLPGGAYLYRLTTPNHSTVRKITLSN